MKVLQEHPSPPCQTVGVEACLDLVVEEGYQETQVVVVVVEVPSQVAVVVVVVEEVLACLVQVAEEVEEEYRHDPVKEEGVVEQVCLQCLVVVGAGAGAEVEGAYLHSGQGEEGQAVEGANQVLAQEQ